VAKIGATLEKMGCCESTLQYGISKDDPRAPPLVQVLALLISTLGRLAVASALQACNNAATLTCTAPWQTKKAQSHDPLVVRPIPSFRTCRSSSPPILRHLVSEGSEWTWRDRRG
jgi:hypothetical protein